MSMSYRLREATLPVLPTGHEPIRILHFSDLHLTPKRLCADAGDPQSHPHIFS